MLKLYNNVRKTFHFRGFEQALQLVQSNEFKTQWEEILGVNLYCYLTIQKNYQPQKNLQLLNDCLDRTECQGPIKALTKHQLSNLYLCMGNYEQSKKVSQEIVNEFIGQYHILKNRFDNSVEQQQAKQQLQQILFYSFSTLKYISDLQNKENQSKEFEKASEKLVKNKQVHYIKSPKTQKKP